MKYEIEKIVNYCQCLFEKHNNYVETIYKDCKQGEYIKLSVTCRSYTYDVIIDKRNLLWLKAKGLVKMTTKIIVSSFGVFGTETNFVFIIDKYKLMIRREKRIIVGYMYFTNLFWCNKGFDIFSCRPYFGMYKFSRKFVFYAINKLSHPCFTTEKIDYYYRFLDYFQYLKTPEKIYSFVFDEFDNCRFLSSSLYDYCYYFFKGMLKKIIHDTNTIYKKVEVLKEGVIQLPNGKFIKKTKTRVLNIKSYMTPYKWVNKCISGIDVNNMTDEEQFIMVDYFLGLSDEGKDVIEKYSVTKLDLDKIRQLNK